MIQLLKNFVLFCQLMDRNSSEVSASMSSTVSTFSIPACLLAGYVAYYVFFVVKVGIFNIIGISLSVSVEQ
jgi:hypothetical protein